MMGQQRPSPPLGLSHTFASLRLPLLPLIRMPQPPSWLSASFCRIKYDVKTSPFPIYGDTAQ